MGNVSYAGMNLIQGDRNCSPWCVFFFELFPARDLCWLLFLLECCSKSKREQLDVRVVEVVTQLCTRPTIHLYSRQGT